MSLPTAVVALQKASDAMNDAAMEAGHAGHYAIAGALSAYADVTRALRDAIEDVIEMPRPPRPGIPSVSERG